MRLALRPRPIALRTGALIATATLALAVGSCSHDPTIPDAVRSVPAAPSHLISDGVHGGGNVNFYFLPPMVKQPSFSGVFDPTVASRVSVDICVVSGSACGALVATFTPTSGPGGVLVQTDASSQYSLDWRTDQFPLDLSKTYRITIRVAGTALGVADVVLISNGSAKNTATNDDIPLVDGRTLPIKFRIEHGAVGVISPTTGGTATLANGSVTVVFPAGAVSTEIGVTATPLAVGGDGTDTSILSGTRFEFEPSPTTFAQPVALTLAYPAVLPAHMHADRLALCKMVGGACVAIAGGRVDLAAHTVTGQISSFSEYGVTEWPAVLRWVDDHQSWDGAGTWIAGWLSTAAGEVQVVPNGGEGPGDVLSWSPDGSRLAYMALAADGGNEIRVVNADGTANVMIYYHPRRARFAKWSPAGDRILFLGWDDNFCTGEACKLMVMSPTGTGLTQLAVTDPWYNAASWSPNGQQIAFANSAWDGSGCLCVINADGTGPRALVRSVYQIGNIYSVSGIAWSPDGRQIAFQGADSSTGQERVGVFVVNADGSNLRQVAAGGALGVQWSPTGADVILYTRSGDDSGPPPGIYAVSSDGSGERLIAPNGDIPSWSPDGLRIAFSRDGRTYIINLDGTGLQTLSNGLVAEYDPFWRP